MCRANVRGTALSHKGVSEKNTYLQIQPIAELGGAVCLAMPSENKVVLGWVCNCKVFAV